MDYKTVGPTESCRNKTYKYLKKASQDLKINRTEAEIMLWSVLRGDKLGARFRQQQIIGNFIVDFYCYEHSLVIEVDGGIHDNQLDKDQARDECLSGLGFTVLRFKNSEITKDLKSVLRAIKVAIKK